MVGKYIDCILLTVHAERKIQNIQRLIQHENHQDIETLIIVNNI